MEKSDKNKEVVGAKADQVSMLDLTEKFLFSGATFKDLRGFTDEEMEAVYGIAYNLYNSGKFKDAVKIFHFLTYFDHLKPRYWFGLGACKQMLKQYEEALSAYAMVSMMDLSDARVFLFIADCNLAINAPKEAKASLELCIELAGDKKEYAQDKKRAEGLLKLLDKGKSK